MFAQTFARTRTSLASKASIHAFARGAARHEALARYETPVALLEAIAPSSGLTVEERDAVLVPLLAEARTSKDEVWPSILVLAFEKLLARVRARIGQPTSARFGRSLGDDLDQSVFVAFSRVVRALVVTSHAAYAVRLAVEREVYDARRKELKAPEPDVFDDDTFCADKFEISERAKAAGAEIARVLDEEGGRELRDMMLATRVAGERLRDYVARVHADRCARDRKAIERQLGHAAVRMERLLRKRAKRDATRRPRALAALHSPTSPTPDQTGANP
jgi:hypothetical protein